MQGWKKKQLSFLISEAKFEKNEANLNSQAILPHWILQKIPHNTGEEGAYLFATEFLTSSELPG